MDNNNAERISGNTECAPHHAVSGFAGHVKIPNTGFDKSKVSKTKLAKTVHNTANKSSHIFILTPVDTNIYNPNISCNTSNGLTRMIIPNCISNNSVSPQNINLSSESCNETDVSPDIIVLDDDADSESATVQQHVSVVSQGIASFNFVAALLQDNLSPVQSEHTEIECSNILQTITNISHVVEQIFLTSNEGILITLPCTPGFEKAKVGPADRAAVKHGSTSSFGLCDECVLEKKFNIIFHQLSAGFLSNLSSESDIKRLICSTMNLLMEVMPVDYALTLTCNCSLCWFLYMCAKVIYRYSPDESHKLNWSGSPISSYRCLAMRKIFITDVTSVADGGYEKTVSSSFSLQLRFTRSGQKRRLFKRSEHFKSVKRNMDSLGSNLHKVSKVTVKAHVNASVSSGCLNCVRSDPLVKNIVFKFEDVQRFKNPEEDVFVFNPVRQFKGNTYARRKNSGMRLPDYHTVKGVTGNKE
jgi:hypothetical protein